MEMVPLILLPGIGEGDYIFKAGSIGDIDNDGQGDIALLNTAGDKILIYKNHGNGHFTSSELNIELQGASDIEFADFDKDDDLDFQGDFGPQIIWENLVSDNENSNFFTLDLNGTLKTASVLDYEAGDILSIRVQAKDEHNATVEGNFTVEVVRDPALSFNVSGVVVSMHRFLILLMGMDRQLILPVSNLDLVKPTGSRRMEYQQVIHS